jgi:hypothetical protein
MKFTAIEPVEIDFVTQTSIAETKSKILEALRKQGGRIKVDSAMDVVAGFGSRLKMQLFFWAGTKHWLRDVVIKLREKGDKTEVRVAVRDTAGLCDRGIFADTLQQIMYQQALDIKAHFVDAR